ncbi:MAG: deoxyribodipyrimidine photo-lyase [Phycisphaerae bacterium]
MIHPRRVRKLNDASPPGGRYVLYWMQASQRAHWNHALEYAIEQANQLGRPIVAAFGLTDHYLDANERHYAFMLQGLAETRRQLASRGIRLVVRLGSPPEVALQLAADACLLVCDRGYLRHQRQWRRQVARRAPCPVVRVETDAVVPVETASPKQEYAARTLRPRLHRTWEEYLKPVEHLQPARDSLSLELEGVDVSDAAEVLASLEVDRSVRSSDQYRGGYAEAKRRLQEFIDHRLKDYAEKRNDPSLGIQSDMSPYLHFGHISPLEVAWAVSADARHGRENIDAYLEELIVRRELSINHVYYNEQYDRYGGLPSWARATLKKHKSDERPYVYTREQLENARTHDPYWNASMREMRLTGKMHSYMRMYWGKKIIEWTNTPPTAFRWMLEMNNRWFLDGRDPNSYVGVAWCFGTHDRPWQERPVHGTVRYMSAGGLERKFDIDAYLRQVEELSEGQPGGGG